MRKNLLFTCLLLLGMQLAAQKVIVVNGGQFGSTNWANVGIYDPQSSSYNVIDSIRMTSIQDVLIDSGFAYVAADDSIVKYDLNTEQRVAIGAFPGASTKELAVYKNDLLVGNWFGRDSNNLYIFDKNTLALHQSIPQITKGAKSMVVNGDFAYIAQNFQTSSFSDSAGYISIVNLATRSFVSNFTNFNNGNNEDVGELIPMRSGNGFFSLNAASNTISNYFWTNQTGNTYSFPFNLAVDRSSRYSIHNDTLFCTFNGGIGAIDISSDNSFPVLDTNIVDTIITAFAYDTSAHRFYITQTDFFSFTKGGIYNRDGSKVGNLPVGFSPEAIAVFYNNATGIVEVQREVQPLTIYPNPSQGRVNLQLPTEMGNRALLQVFDTRGQLIKVQTWQGEQLSLEELPKGIYYMQAINEKGKSFGKLIIE